MQNINKFTINYIEKSKELVLLIVIVAGLLTTFSLKDPIVILFYTFLFVNFYVLNKKEFRNGKEFLLWRLYVAYIFFSCIVGLFFFAEIYFDYKALVFNFFKLILPVMLTILLRNPISFTIFYKTWLKWGVILVLISIPFIPGYQVGKSFTAILFLALFFKDLTIKYKLISISIILIGLILNDGSRSVVARSVIFGLIAIGTYFPSIVKKIKPLILLAFLIPILLFFAATFFNFNILALNKDNTSYTIKDNGASGAGTDGTRSLTADTRTFLYEESFLSAIHNNYILFGRTPARGHDSATFGDGKDGTRKGERNGDEIGILNVFNWLGLVGVVLYGSCFLYSIWLGLYRSRNLYTIYGAMLLQFFWIYSWLEEIQAVRWDYLTIFLIVPFITSNSFRQMTNIEMKMFINKITCIKKV
ncbi:MAG: hypothetical protein JWN56_2248 [Sphingobacteriales bacterium]|nr:hypothetical protein [Sphingobacteriales bacterium]